MKTQIFNSYQEFQEREDKTINGVSPEYAKRNPNYQEDNATNQGCYESSGCTGSIDCLQSWNLKDCTNCSTCSNSENCNNCSYCSWCYACVGLTNEHNQHFKIK